MRHTDPWEDTGLFPLVSRHGAPRRTETTEHGERPWSSPGRPPWEPEEEHRPSGLLKWLALVLVIVAGAVLVGLGTLGHVFG
jgi:hypothetical protein